MIELQKLNVFYGTSHIIHDLDLEIRQGEVFCLLGRNGVGKTTLLRGLMGIDVRTTGTIRFKGEEVGQLPTYERARRGIGRSCHTAGWCCISRQRRGEAPSPT